MPCAQDNPLIRKKISRGLLVNPKSSCYEEFFRLTRRNNFRQAEKELSLAEFYQQTLTENPRDNFQLGHREEQAHLFRRTGFNPERTNRGEDYGQMCLWRKNFNRRRQHFRRTVKDCRVFSTGRQSTIYMVNESVAACAQTVKNLSPNPKPIIICNDLPRLKIGNAVTNGRTFFLRKMFEGRKILSGIAPIGRTNDDRISTLSSAERTLLNSAPAKQHWPAFKERKSAANIRQTPKS